MQSHTPSDDVRFRNDGAEMEFGIFDHLDPPARPCRIIYEDRLKSSRPTIARLLRLSSRRAPRDAARHGASPNVFLAAVAQRTKRLRFGPMVFCVPLYHPLRLLEEICMLDQMSGGRLELGFGRGASPIELDYLASIPKRRKDIYAEAVEVILRGLTHRRSSFHGKHFSFDNVPMEIAPCKSRIRRSGTACMRRTAPSARRNVILNVVSLDPPADTRLTDRGYRATWRPPHPGAAAEARPRPLHRGRRSDAEALRACAPRLTGGIAASHICPRLRGRAANHPRPAELDALVQRGQGIAGSPETVTEFLQRSLPRRLQLRRRAVCVRRSDARRVCALDRAVCRRSDAGVARMQSGRRSSPVPLARGFRLVRASLFQMPHHLGAQRRLLSALHFESLRRT